MDNLDWLLGAGGWIGREVLQVGCRENPDVVLRAGSSPLPGLWVSAARAVNSGSFFFTGSVPQANEAPSDTAAPRESQEAAQLSDPISQCLVAPVLLHNQTSFACC